MKMYEFPEGRQMVLHVTVITIYRQVVAVCHSMYMMSLLPAVETAPIMRANAAHTHFPRNSMVRLIWRATRRHVTFCC